MYLLSAKSAETERESGVWSECVFESRTKMIMIMVQSTRDEDNVVVDDDGRHSSDVDDSDKHLLNNECMHTLDSLQ